MSSLLPVALWSLRVAPGQSPVPAVLNFPATIRLTMAAIDPSAKPYEAGKPKRAILKILREPIPDPDSSDSDSDSDEESDKEEEKGTKSSPKGKQSPKSKTNSDEMTDAADDDFDDSDSATEEPEEVESLVSFIICTLDSDKHYQQTLDLVIGDDEFVYFRVDGNYDVYLTGNYVVSPGDAYDSDSEDDDDEYDLSPDEDELYPNEETDSDELDDLDDPPRIQEVDTDEGGAEEASKGAVPANGASKKDKKVEKTEKVDKKVDKKSLKRPAEDEEPRTIDEMIEGVKPTSENKGEAEKKLSKKQLKKLKANDGKAVEATTDSKAKEAKKVQFAKELEQGPTGSPVTAEKKEKKTPSAKRVVQGVTVMDSKVGTGSTAKKGNKLCMRYIGKLENGKVFDSNTKGKPFAFQLGKGEVIKGWDVGLEGMRVGGERRLNIPAALAYGKQSTAGIPANSNLIFDVKLTDIK